MQTLLPTLIEGMRLHHDPINQDAGGSLKYIISIGSQPIQQSIQTELSILLGDKDAAVRCAAANAAAYLLEFGLSCITKTTPENPETPWLRATQELRWGTRLMTHDTNLIELRSLPPSLC